MKILVISNDDGVWLLPAWGKFASSGLSVDSIDYILLPDKIGNLRFVDSLIWSLRTFGFTQWFGLAFYSLIRRFKNRKETKLIRSSSSTISDLDSDFILDFILTNNIDLVVITCSYIIPQKLLTESQIPWINKHSSLLPNCKGLFPYVWSEWSGSATGVTYHLVTKKIDSGEHLFQKEIHSVDSMVDFYNTVYADFPQDLSKAIEIYGNSLERIVVEHDYPESYFSLPTRDDMKSFYALGGKVILPKDFVKLFQ
jgi:folate-dependent phosphoribosylglycinamide formyltransferase PurN